MRVVAGPLAGLNETGAGEENRLLHGAVDHVVMAAMVGSSGGSAGQFIMIGASSFTLPCHCGIACPSNSSRLLGSR